MLRETSVRPAARALTFTLLMVLSSWAALGTPAGRQMLDAPAQHASTTENVTTTAWLDASNSSYWGGNDSLADLGGSGGNEARWVLSVPLTQAVGGPIANQTTRLQSLELDVVCSLSSGSGTLIVTPARIVRSVNMSAITWGTTDGSTSWGSNGADGGADRGDWDPAVLMAGSGSYTVNVTALAQDALRNGQNTLTVMLAGTSTGSALYQCHSHASATPASRPIARFDWQTENAAAQPTLSDISPAPGSGVGDGSLLFAADTTPTLGWSGSSGAGHEVQLSRSADFRDADDGAWTWDSWNDAGFTGTASGTYDVAGAAGLAAGDVIHWRVRATAGDQLGDWNQGWIVLPSLTGSDAGDGNATFDLRRGVITTEADDMIDAWLRQGSASSDDGDSTTAEIGRSSTPSKLIMSNLLKFELGWTGMPLNATIVNATLQLDRTGSIGSPTLVVSELFADDWTESATWQTSDGSDQWTRQGARDSPEAGEALDAVDASTGSTLEFEVTAAVQAALSRQAAGGDGSVNLVLTSSTLGSTSALISSSHAATAGDRPTLSVTYRWGDGVLPMVMEGMLPEDGRGVWNVSDDNLSANGSPVLQWDTTNTSGWDMILEIADDPGLMGSVYDWYDSRWDSEVDPASGEFDFTAEYAPDIGDRWFWRTTWVDGQERGPSSGWQSFVMPNATTDYQANGSRFLRLQTGNASVAGGPQDVPNCQDVQIFQDPFGPSGNYEDEGTIGLGNDGSGGRWVGLIGCDVRAMQPPDGYAIAGAWLRMTATSNVDGSPTVQVYESNVHDWRSDEANWSTYDGANLWDEVGAQGAERANYIDSWARSGAVDFQINVTEAAQRAVRDGTSLDVILDIDGAAGGALRSMKIYDDSASSSDDRPELILSYVAGSAVQPAAPAAVFPAAGGFAVEPGFEPKPDPTPTFAWTFDNSTTIVGWEVQLDRASSFDSANLLVYRSWDSAGFDVSGHRFTPDDNMTEGHQWFWRVRGSSSTGQVGAWSTTADFLLPDLTTSRPDNDTVVIEVRHADAIPGQTIPDFDDTWIVSGSGSSNVNGGGSTMRTGYQSSALYQSSLLRIPLDQIPLGTGGHLVEAQLHLRTSSISGASVRVGLEPVYPAWIEDEASGDEYATGMNWDDTGALGDTDAGDFVDINTVTTGGTYEFNVTELVQQTLDDGSDELNVALRGDPTTPGRYVDFHSSEASTTSFRPWLELTFVNGTVSVPGAAPTLLEPIDGGLSWNTSTLALTPDPRPTFSWSHPEASNATGWRVLIQNNANDELAGATVYDSRENATGFDLVNLTWTPPTNLTAAAATGWQIQMVVQDILSPRSDLWQVNVPNSIGEQIDNTTGRVWLQQGAAVVSSDAPAAFLDATIRQATPTTNAGTSTVLSAGGTTSDERRSVMEIDFAKASLPDPWHTLDARLELYRTGGTSANARQIAIIPLTTTFDEADVTWRQREDGTDWDEEGALGAADASGVEVVTAVSVGGWYEWNITAYVQAAHTSGDDVLRFALVAEPGSTIRQDFASSEYTFNRSRRPILNITYSTTEGPWVPATVSGAMPADNATLWDTGAARPRGIDPVQVGWTHGASGNITAWQLQFAEDHPQRTNRVLLDSRTDTSTYGAFDLGNLTFDFNSGTWPDSWVHWRVRPIVDDRTGDWNEMQRFRVPPDLGWDDGAGNQTVNLSHGAIFSSDGVSPSVPDAFVDAGRPGTNFGTNDSLAVGVGSGTGEAHALFSFDLDSIDLPDNATITQAELRVRQSDVIGASGTTVVGAHSCNGFNAAIVNWTIKPSCDAAALSTASLLASGGAVWYGWDVTLAVQAAGVNGTATLGLLPNGTANGRHVFNSAEAEDRADRPVLSIRYVLGSISDLPPGQPTLTAPPSGEILYTDSNTRIVGDTLPTLSWTPVAGSTGYVITLSSDAGDSGEYRSWADPGFSGTNYTVQAPLDTDTTYSWRVRAINGSMPGPASEERFFGVPDVSSASLGNHVWDVDYRQDHDVGLLSHPTIIDTHVSEGATETGHGSSALEVGLGCDGLVSTGNECRSLIEVDLSQIGYPAMTNHYAASLQIHLRDLQFDSSGTELRLSIHELNAGFNENTATWNLTNGAIPWNTPGLGSGTDYVAAPLDEVIIRSGDVGGFVLFDITGALAGAPGTGTVSFVVIGVPDTGQGIATFTHSEHATTSQRPLLNVQYTDVALLNIDAPTTTVDADGTIDFDHIAQDGLGANLTIAVEWSVSNGSIDNDGLFTPLGTGTVIVTVRHGLRSTAIPITVTPGLPQTLFVDPPSATITADQVLQITAEVRDANGNAVPSAIISWTLSNGSIGIGPTFQPWSVGLQSVQATWSAQTATINVNVLEGAPALFELDEGITVHAGESHQFAWSLTDQKGNPLASNLAGPLTWGATNGSVNTTGYYTGWTAGVWQVTLNGGSGAVGSTDVTVIFGAIDHLVLNASAANLTADEEVAITVVQVDLRGNMLPLDVPVANWTATNGTFVSRGGDIYWQAWRTGLQNLVATHAGATGSTDVLVGHGAPVGLVVTASSNNATADQVVELTSLANDQRGNLWFVESEWRLLTNGGGPWLAEDAASPGVMLFNATLVGVWEIEAQFAREGGLGPLLATTVIGVTPGLAASITLTGPAGAVTADDALPLNPRVQDADGNAIDPGVISWTVDDISATSALQSNGYVWNATTRGTHWINASVGQVTAFVTVEVAPGVAVRIEHSALTSDFVAGAGTSVTLRAFDADGNDFAIGSTDVVWEFDSQVGTVIPDVGRYGEFDLVTVGAGEWNLVYRAANGNASGSWTITTRANVLAAFTINMSDDVVEQQTEVTVTVTAYDEYGNVLPVPQGLLVRCGCDPTGQAEQIGANTWRLYALETGIWQVQVDWGTASASEDLEVTGTVGGFFESGGAPVVAGAILIPLIIIAVLVLVVLLVLRGGGEEEEWEDDEEDEPQQVQKSYVDAQDTSALNAAQDAFAALDALSGGPAPAGGGPGADGPPRPTDAEVAAGVEFAQRTGVMQAVGGTVQGQSGWYVDADGTLAQWDVDSSGGWNRIG